jgi:hypothetical protein
MLPGHEPFWLTLKHADVLFVMAATYPVWDVLKRLKSWLSLLGLTPAN